MPEMTERANRDMEKEIAALEVMASEFEDYIVEGDVYRTILVPAERGNYRMEMSGGDLLRRIDLDQSAQSALPRELKERLNGVTTQIETTKQELKTRFHDLLKRELTSRLRALSWSNDNSADSWDDNEDNEKEKQTPAEQHNLLCIAAIREEIGGSQMEDTVDGEIEELEKKLQAAIEELNRNETENLSS